MCNVMLYKICGFVIESDIPLPELPCADGKEPEWTFQLFPAQEAESVFVQWFHHWRLPTGEIWLSFAKQGSAYLLRFPELADFIVCGYEKELRCYPGLGTPLATIRHLLLDQVIPVALATLGRLVLHASAVVTSVGAIAFSGISGWGKSSLTASFIQQGFPLLTDDCLVLEEKEKQIFAIPSYPGVRLWDDVVSALFEHEQGLSDVAHYTDKKRLGLNGLNNNQLRFCSDSVPLKRIYILAPPDVGNTKAINITPISSQEVFIELVSYAYKLDITDREKLKQEFDCLGRVAALPLFYRLAFPRDFSLLPVVRESILNNLSERYPNDAAGDKPECLSYS